METTIIGYIGVPRHSLEVRCMFGGGGGGSPKLGFIGAI